MVLKRIARPEEAASVPVSACGYMNSAIAEPMAERDVGPELLRRERQPRRRRPCSAATLAA